MTIKLIFFLGLVFCTIINIRLLDRTEGRLADQSFFCLLKIVNPVLMFWALGLILSQELSLAESLIQLVFYRSLIYQASKDAISGLVDPRDISLSYILIFLLRLLFSVSLGAYLISSILVFSALYLIYKILPGGLGGGDLKFYSLVGLSLGLVPALKSLYYSSVLALLYLFFLGLRGRKLSGYKLSFLPFVALGIILMNSLGL